MLAFQYLKTLLNRSCSEEQGANSFLSPSDECNVTALSCLHILLYLNYEHSNDMVPGIRDKMLFFHMKSFRVWTSLVVMIVIIKIKCWLLCCDRIAFIQSLKVRLLCVVEQLASILYMYLNCRFTAAPPFSQSGWCLVPAAWVPQRQQNALHVACKRNGQCSCRYSLPRPVACVLSPGEKLQWLSEHILQP